MATSKNVIRAPKPPIEAFNKDRPVSQLLRTQTVSLANAWKKHIDDEVKAIKTEGEASAFVKKVTTILHQQAAKAK